MLHIVGAVGYLAAMTWITGYAPPGAQWPAFFILHGAIVIVAALMARGGEGSRSPR